MWGWLDRPYSQRSSRNRGPLRLIRLFRVTKKTATHYVSVAHSECTAKLPRWRSAEPSRLEGRIVGVTVSLRGRITPSAGRMLFGEGGHSGDGFSGAVTPDEQLGHFQRPHCGVRS